MVTALISKYLSLDKNMALEVQTDFENKHHPASFPESGTVPLTLLPVVGHRTHCALSALLLSPLAHVGSRTHHGWGDLRPAGWLGCHRSPGVHDQLRSGRRDNACLSGWGAGCRTRPLKSAGHRCH